MTSHDDTPSKSLEAPLQFPALIMKRQRAPCAGAVNLKVVLASTKLGAWEELLFVWELRASKKSSQVS